LQRILTGALLNNLLTSIKTDFHRIHDEKMVATKSQLLTHLPQLQQAQTTYISMLHFTPNDEFVRLVWNKALQDTYSIFDIPTPYVPSIIYRQATTIQDSGGETRAPKRPRLKANTENL